MKTTLTIILIILAIDVSAQYTGSISVDAGSLLNGKSKNYFAALNVGIINWNHNQGSIGLIMKNYQTKTVLGLRISGMVKLFGDHILAYTDNEAIFNRGEKYHYQDING